MCNSTKIEIIKIKPEDTLQIRHDILLPEETVEECFFDNDWADLTVHFGAFVSEKLVGVISVSKENWHLFPDKNQWRGRAIAVVPEERNNGVGDKLLQACLRYAKENGGTIFWATARLPTLPYHRKKGFIITEEEEHEEVINEAKNIIVKVKIIYQPL